MALGLRTKLQIVVRACIGALAVVWASMLWSLPVAAASFSGQFEGIGTAVGMTLTLEESEGRVVGRFASGRGEAFSLNGRRTGEAAQGSLMRPGQRYFFHLEPRPLGVQFLLIPKAPDGGPDISGSTDYSFVQQGLHVPQPSAFQAAPPRGISVDIIDFIDGFRDWNPVDMARIYASLDDRYKELIQLFDHAASEVVWRVCATSPPNVSFPQSELDRLLERQHATCERYLSSVAKVRDAGLLNEFLRKANFQFELIRETVKCDRGQSPETKCADVSAMSGPLMVRWRRAMDVMSDLVGEDSATEPLQQIVPVEPELPSASEQPQSDVSETQGGYPLPVQRPRSAVEVSDEAPVELEPEVEEVVEEEAIDPTVSVPLPRVRPGVRLRH